MSHPENIARLLQPQTIAVVGGSLAEIVIRQCDRIGFAGEIWPITPYAAQMAGRQTYPDVASLPGSPDASFIAVNKHKTVETAAALRAIRAGGAVCYASGFSEEGEPGVELQRALDQAMGDVAYIGPNCYGMLNYLDGVALWPDEHGGQPIDEGAAIIMQSGNIGISMTMQQRGLPLAYMISVGNQAGIQMHEYVDALLADARVKAIGLHVEGFGDVAAFSEAALRALQQGIPIVVLKSGVSERGRELTMSHTSSLSGSDDLYSALFKRLGIMRAESLPEFLEALKFLSIVGSLPGPQFASISCSGGEAAIMADSAYRLGVPAAKVLAPQRAALKTVLGDRVAINNPLDYHTYIWDDEAAQTACFSAMMLGPQAITLKILDYPRADVCSDEQWVKTARAFVRAHQLRGGKAALVSTLHENLPSHAREMLIEHGIAPMMGIEECLRVVKGAALIGLRQREANQVLALAPVQAMPGRFVSLDEADSKRRLAEHGLPVPDFRVVGPDTVEAAARDLGYPVTLKILSADIVHKTDVGGVHLGIQDLAQLRAAVDALEALEALGDRYLLEPMAAAPVVEMILGISRDPQFGLCLVIGAGGILVEWLQDSVPLLLPTDRDQVERAISGLRVNRLLAGYRGSEPADRTALVHAVLALADFAETHADRILDVDINPLFVYPQGQGVLAVDAAVRWSDEGKQTVS